MLAAQPLSSRARSLLLSAGGLLALLAAIKVAVQLVAATGYGYFVDELYYLAMQRHLDFGYVDVPPGVPALMAVSNATLGTSIFALHVFPAIAGALTVVFVGLTAREMGGGRFAQALAGLAVLVAPFWLILDSWFAYDAFDQLVTAALFYVWVRLMKEPSPRRWLIVGAVVGLSLLTKLSIVFTGPALAAAFLIGPSRRQIATPWPWLAALLALAMFSPFLLWQAAHGWPILTYWPNYAQYRAHPGLPEFAGLLLFGLNPLAVPISLLGLWWLLSNPEGRRYQSIGVAFLLLAVYYAFVVHTESRMLLSAFLPLTAAGAVAVERALATGRWRPRIRTGYAALLLVSALVMVPSSLPVRIASPSSSDTTAQDVPEYERLRVGWPEMAADVAAVYRTLPPEDRQRAVIYAGNYGEAAAIDFFGAKYGLPHAISNHLTYQVWGPGDRPLDVVIAFGDRFTKYEEPGRVPLDVFFWDVTRVATIERPDAPEWEQEIPIYLCRSPKFDLRLVWPELAFYY